MHACDTHRHCSSGVMPWSDDGSALLHNITAANVLPFDTCRSSQPGLLTHVQILSMPAICVRTQVVYVLHRDGVGTLQCGDLTAHLEAVQEVAGLRHERLGLVLVRRDGSAQPLLRPRASVKQADPVIVLRSHTNRKPVLPDQGMML